MALVHDSAGDSCDVGVVRSDCVDGDDAIVVEADKSEDVCVITIGSTVVADVVVLVFAMSGMIAGARAVSTNVMAAHVLFVMTMRVCRSASRVECRDPREG